MAPIFCCRCGDAVEEGCDPRDELAELDALLERLRLKRYDLKRKINQFHSPIVRQLPPDVTSTIFEFCLPDVTDYPLPVWLYVEETFSIPFSPLSLGAICGYWRDIAWSTPSLWSSLAIHDPDKYNSHIVTIAQEWLTRSGQLPLSIFILSTFYNKTVLALIDIINQYSTRWSSLDLCIHDIYYQHFHAYDNHAVIHAPILKSIRLHRAANRSATTLNFQLASCPRLERASLSQFPINVSNIQWDNLTHLTLNSMSIINTFRILRKTPRLVFCQVSGFYPPVREQITEPPVVSSMKSLQLLMRNNSENFLDNLIAPYLEECNYSRHYIPRTEVFIASFFKRSACSLRSLSMIFSIPQYFEDFMNLLQSMPSLTKLSIISITTEITTLEEYHPRNILQLLAKVLSSQSTSPQRGFLPNLKILEFTGKLYLHSGNYDDIYPLPPVDNTVHGPFHLFKLDLYPITRIAGSMIPYISSLAERGVTVNVVSGSEDILQSSIDYHRCKEDSLTRSRGWSDNLDLSFLS
jgi:hypothetical protein